MRTYSIVVDPDPEGGYTVTVPRSLDASLRVRPSKTASPTLRRPSNSIWRIWLPQVSPFRKRRNIPNFFR
jgi:hypothetical protein